MQHITFRQNEELKNLLYNRNFGYRNLPQKGTVAVLVAENSVGDVVELVLDITNSPERKKVVKIEVFDNIKGFSKLENIKELKSWIKTH